MKISVVDKLGISKSDMTRIDRIISQIEERTRDKADFLLYLQTENRLNLSEKMYVAYYWGAKMSYYENVQRIIDFSDKID